MKRPNVILIMTDQQRANLLAREGYALDTMPFCDQLAREGQWFNRAYTSCPACVPARVAALTGRFGSANRVRCNQQNLAIDTRASGDLISLLQSAGYVTALCGKNHSHVPNERFDFHRHYLHCHSDCVDNDDHRAFDAWMKTTGFHLSCEPTPFPTELQYPYRIVDDAIKWIDRRNQQQAFFLWLSFPEPHNPYQVPHPYWDMFPPERLPPTTAGEADLNAMPFPWRWCLDRFRAAFPDYDSTRDRARSNYHGMLRLVDDQIRRFVGHLDRIGLRDDTLLILTSDHGDFVGEFGLLRKGPRLPELLTRIPFIANGPGIKPSGDSPNPAHISLVDLLPTICSFANAEVPPGVQGRNLRALWQGDDDPTAFRSILVEHGFGGPPYDGTEPKIPEDGHRPSPDGRTWGEFDCLNSVTQSGVQRSVRMSDWKLVASNDGSRELYHLPEDPCELHNRWLDPSCAEVCNEMLNELLAWMLAVQDDLPTPAKRYLIKSGRTAPYSQCPNSSAETMNNVRILDHTLRNIGESR